jgi:hypothetical protein
MFDIFWFGVPSNVGGSWEYGKIKGKYKRKILKQAHCFSYKLFNTPSSKG